MYIQYLGLKTLIEPDMINKKSDSMIIIFDTNANVDTLYSININFCIASIQKAFLSGVLILRVKNELWENFFRDKFVQKDS